MPTLALGLGLGRQNKNHAFTPAALSGLVLWLDADDNTTITESAGRVSQWADKSGKNNHATAGSGHQPATGTHNINGKNALHWDATARRMVVTPNSDFLHSSGQHVFIVAEWDTLNTFSAVYSRFAFAGSREFNLIKQNATAPSNSLYSQYTTDGSTVATFGKKTSIEIDTPYVVYGSAQAGEYVEVGVNKALADQRVLEPTNIYDDPTPPYITIGDQTTTGVPMRGKIAEVIVVNGVLSKSDKDAILKYLGEKWAIDVVPSYENIVAAGVGQSNMTNWSNTVSPYNKDGQNAFETTIKTVKKEAYFFNGAVNGSAVLEAADTGAGHWIKNDLTDGGAFTGFLTNAVDYTNGIAGDISRYNEILIANGEADATAIASATITKAQFKAGLKKLVERLHDEIPNARIIITPVGRRTGGNDSAVQQVRDAQLEVINEKSYCVLGWENYDQDLQDSIHRTPAGYAAEATRAANYILSGSVNPVITDATYSGSTVTANVKLAAAVTISGSEVDTFRIEDDGAPVTINSLSITDDQITFNLENIIAPGSAASLFVNYGQGTGVTTADIVKDSNGNPLQTIAIDIA